jgi:hypothetical protein
MSIDRKYIEKQSQERFPLKETSNINDLHHLRTGFVEGVLWSNKNTYTIDEVTQIWKAGQEYWKTSGESITLEELLENLKK